MKTLKEKYLEWIEEHQNHGFIFTPSNEEVVEWFEKEIKAEREKTLNEIKFMKINDLN